MILRVHSGLFVIFYVKFFILDFEDCQFTFGSTSFWVVLDFWVFSFGFWILRSVGPPLIAHLFLGCCFGLCAMSDEKLSVCMFLPS